MFNSKMPVSYYNFDLINFTAQFLGPDATAVNRLKVILRLQRQRTTMLTRDILQQQEPLIFTNAVFCDRSNYANH